jgi:hypothetical protein
MKLVNTLNEALGVPKGIIETAKEIFDIIIKSKFNISIANDIDDNVSERNIKFSSFIIGNDIFDKLEYVILVIPNPKADKVIGTGMSLEGRYEKTNDYKVTSINDGTIRLRINFVCPGEVDSDGEANPIISLNNIITGVKNELLSDKNKTIASISHELKHLYDSVKKPKEDLIGMSRYNIVRNYMGINVEPISWFCYSIYFMSVAESLVRPTEVSALINLGNITKQNYLSFLRNNEVYEILNRIKGITYESFYNDLFNYIDEIRGFWNNDSDMIKGFSDEKVVDLFLTNVRLSLQHNTVDYISKMLIGSMPPELAGFFGRLGDVNYIKKASKKIMKYDDNKSFYSVEINHNAKKADFVIRKLAKLYSIAK